MSDSRTPVLFKAINKAEEKGGYTGLIGLREDPKARPITSITPSCATVNATQVANNILTPLTVASVADAASTPKGTSITLSDSSSRKRMLSDIIRKPLRGSGTGILLNTVDTTESKRSESVIVSACNRSAFTFTPTNAKRKYIASSLRPAMLMGGSLIFGNEDKPKAIDGNKNRVTSSATIPSPLITSSVAATPVAKNSTAASTSASSNKFAVCAHCGTTSINFEACDSCGRQMATPKEYEPKTSAQANSKDSEKKLPDCPIASSFYGRKLGDANYPTIKTVAVPLRRKVPLTLQKLVKKPKKSKTPPKIEPPVVLTLSSDDDDDREEEVAEDEENINENGSSAVGTSFAQEVTRTVSDSMFGSTEDILKNHMASGAATPTQSPAVRLPTPSLAVLTGTINLHCRLRIGSYRVTPKDPVIVSSDRFSLKIPATVNENDIATITINVTDIVNVHTYLGQDLPVLFFYLKASCAANIRSRLWMRDKAGPFYDPTCKDNSINRLIMLPEILDENQRNYLNKMFADASAAPSQDDPFHKSINKSLANELLINSSPMKAVEDLDRLCKRNTSLLQAEKKIPNTPVIRHSQRIQNQRRECVTLVTYPPPPAVGGIEVTSEDIRCLVPGEFLNDVIIDFYLKYLFGEKLSPDDQKRTHIFSSFFFKRLTNSDMPSENEFTKDLAKTNGNKALSNAESRHRRVKNWTRNVNIFTKDFIIIPVNENSHWFLVVICFAHLVGVVGDEEQCPPPSADHDYESEMSDDILYGDHNGTNLTLGSSERVAASKSPVEDFGVSKRPCILIFDSLRTHSSWTYVFRLLREYLAIEYQHKMHQHKEFSRETIRASYPMVPQQTNYSDCGIFVLQYVESFFKNPIQNFQPPIRGVDTWFCSEYICQNKRKEIEDLILTLRREQGEQSRTAAVTASASGKS